MLTVSQALECSDGGAWRSSKSLSPVCRHARRCTFGRPVLASLQQTGNASNSKSCVSPLRAASTAHGPATSDDSPAHVSQGDSDLVENIDRLERSLRMENSPSTSGSSKRAVPAVDQLSSTWEHKGITGGSIGLILLLLCKGWSEVHTPLEALSGMGAVLFAYTLSDFLTGVYHWGVDNYGDGNTPIVGGQIAAFQGHHQKPWTITEREFCNNVHKVFKPAAPFAALCLLASPLTPCWLDIGLATATLLTCMSQQFHAWAHMKASELPLVVRILQDQGVLVSRKAHGAHHKAPFEGNYCIESAVWNPILDAGGEQSFFRRLERGVESRTGFQPRCWHDPDYSWQEME